MSIAGARSRRMPSSSSFGAVVAASSNDVARPSVPLASTFQPASSPSTDSARPSTSVRGPAAVNGSRNASTTNGSSISRRLDSHLNGTSANLDSPKSRTA